MTISVNVFDSAEIKEDQKTEFKESIFVDPETHNAGFRQMMTIAETLASFMNADGGMLYVGIGDGKQIYGIGRDLTILATQPACVALHSVRGNDTGHDYGSKASTDKYELKIRAIVKALLSPNASGYLGDVKFAMMGSQQVCRVEAKKCRDDDFVYAYVRHAPGKPEVAEIFKRFGNQKRCLTGAERDEFVRERTRQQVLANVSAVVQQNPAGLIDQVLAAINSAFATTPQVVGTKIVVNGALAIDDPNFVFIKSPKKFVFDGEHVCDVKTWKDAYGALLVKLNETDAAKFDGIAAEPFFSRWFVQIQKHKKYPDYFKDLLGTAPDVRGLVKVGKIHFTNPDYIVHKLLARFGIDPNRVAYVG